MKMNIDGILEKYERGIQPIVVFNKDIEQTESYFENGMWGRLVNVIENNDYYQLVFRVEEFDEHNKSYETADFYNPKTDSYDMTCREAGFHPERNDWCETIHMYKNDIFGFDIKSAHHENLMQEWLIENSDQTFTDWLCDKLIESRQKLPIGV